MREHVKIAKENGKKRENNDLSMLIVGEHASASLRLPLWSLHIIKRVFSETLDNIGLLHVTNGPALRNDETTAQHYQVLNI